MQGYLFSKPVSMEEAIKIVQKTNQSEHQLVNEIG